jgi:glycine cleavage system H lipoate-binding protein
MKKLMNIINPKAMKTQSSFLIMLLIVFTATARPHADHNTNDQNSSGGSLAIEASSDLQPLLNLWESAFNAQNPDLNLKNGKSEVLYLNSMNDSGNTIDQAWNITVGKKIFIPMISNNHPKFELIQKRGITLQLMKDIFSGKEQPVMNLLTGEDASESFRVLIFEDASLVKQLEKSFDYRTTNQAIGQIRSVDEMKSILSAYPTSIVLMPLSVLHAQESPVLFNGYSILPIDKNENGSIERMEDFYGNFDVFIRSVWIGKYPHSLTVPVLISSASNVTDAQITFIQWALTSGQRFLAEAGCVDLSGIEREAALAMIIAPVAETEAAKPASAWIIILVVIVGGIGLLGFLVTWLFRSSKVDNPVPTDTVRNGLFNEDSIESPKGILYDKTHTWAFMENDGMVRIGMDGFIGHLAGNTSRVVAKQIGEKVAKGDHIITLVCNGKKMELRSPISGIIRAFNTSLENGISAGKLAENWVYNIEPANWKRDSQFMIMYDQYRLWLKEEFARLRDFLAITLNAHSPQYAQIALQDGGELREGLLAELGPEVWEDFQYGFLDSLK